MKTRMIDPPSGWKYGFPKPIPNDIKDARPWLVENGYPQEEIDNLGEYFYCRYWESDTCPVCNMKDGKHKLDCHGY
jgi:hypothetical protein